MESFKRGKIGGNLCARFVTPMQVRVFPLISTRGCQLRTPYPRFHLIELIHSQSNQIAWMSNFTHDPFSSLRTFYRYVEVSNRLIHIFALIAPNYLPPSLVIIIPNTWFYRFTKMAQYDSLPKFYTWSFLWWIQLS